MRHIEMSYVACPTVPYFATLSLKRYDFRSKFIEREIYVMIFSSTFIRKISNSNLDAAKRHKCTQVFM